MAFAMRDTARFDWDALRDNVIPSCEGFRIQPDFKGCQWNLQTEDLARKMQLSVFKATYYCFSMIHNEETQRNWTSKSRKISTFF